MATYLHRVAENFRWRMEGITPAHSYGSPPIRFRRFDPVDDEPDNTSGWVRRFFSRWVGAQIDSAATNLEGREAVHLVELHVLYPTAALPFDTLESMMLQDRHDIAKTLRDQGKRNGWSDATASTDIGIYMRRRGSPDRVTPGGSLLPGLVDLRVDVLQLITEWHVKVREEE